MSQSTPPLRTRVKAKPTPPPAAVVIVKPKGPAKTPRKPPDPPVKVGNPQRLRKKNRKVNGFFIGGKGWGCPFRVREIDGRWHVVWEGDDMKLAWYKPRGWRDLPYGSRVEAAQASLEAFRAWITHPDQSGLLDRAKAVMAGFNLVCNCPPDYPCHGDVLLELVNSPPVREIG